ncbi:MAG: NAD-dependent epimerase/dehydratase family protein [Chloroflexota bacterium]
MRIVVTGGAGRIGAWVVKALQDDFEVVIFDRRPPQEQVKARVVIGDHADLGQLCEACAGAEAILHLSAIPGLGPQTETTVFQTNGLGAYAIHQAAALMGIDTVVSTSSQSAYGWAWGKRDFLPRYLPLDEEHPDEPDEAYGLSKVVGEQIAWSFHRKTGMRTVVLRPPLVLAPGEYGKVLQLSAARSWRATLFSYVDVRDLASAFRLALERREVVCDAFNVAADDALAEEPLSDLLPRLDPRLAPLAAALRDNQPMVSNAKIKRLLGWAPRHSWQDEEPRGV